MTTIETLTIAQIDSLCAEAAAAGDFLTVSDCQVARGAVDSTATPEERRAAIVAARERIVAVIRNAEAQQ